MSKKVAKSVADSLNSIPVGGKRKSKAHDQTWNIKYLPRFKWVHLSERLAYEAAVRQQRLRTEISQVKREAEHFKSSVESGKRKRSRGSKDSAAAGGAVEEVATATVQKPFVFQQKETEAQIRKRKMVEEVNTSTSRVEPEVKKKKLKKKKESEKAATEKSKSKKGKKLQQETKKVRSKEG